MTVSSGSSVNREVPKFNQKIAFIIFMVLVIPILVIIWIGGRIFIYDICAAKAHKTIPKAEWNVLSPPTAEELREHPNLVSESAQLTQFYHEVLKCYRDSKSRFYLWY